MSSSTPIHVIKRSGRREVLDFSKVEGHVRWACEGLSASPEEVLARLDLMFYDGIKTRDVQRSTVMAAAQLITKNADYSYVAARLTLQEIYKEVTDTGLKYPPLDVYLEEGVREGRLDPRVLDPYLFDLDELDAAIRPNRDLQFNYLGIQTIFDRYLIRETSKVRGQQGAVIEMPQHMFMRVAMGLAFNEDNPTERALEFYNLLSSFDYMNSTPTLFNSATLHPQLSSCYLTYVEDDLDRIFVKGYREAAMLSKFAGGIGTSWTPLRSEGDIIKSTNGRSSGIVPYLKIFNDTAVAVNQGGKRKGAFAAYLELWHGDILEFLELREMAGDELRRARQIFTAGWICDLFMERKEQDGDWSLFSPNEFPELHELHGEAFRQAYEAAEATGKAVRVVKAKWLWKELLNALYRTGGPWVTFKDECNRRNPQQHVGVIHNSNLCTEITLNNGPDETAVCNLGSVNLANHVNDDGNVDMVRLSNTVRTAMRMLDNVIDLNYYPTEDSRRSNLRHRPVGLGVMGYAEALLKSGIDWESEEQVAFSDVIMEAISFFAISASADLASERGAYQTFEGSLWSQGILPIDTARDKQSRLFSVDDWAQLREQARRGMRNSNCMAIAPTATIANIVGTTECCQPIYERVSTKENLSGSFDVPNPLAKYNRPELVKTVWEVGQEWLVRAAAARQKWIDQSQSLNLYMNVNMRGRDLDALYTLAWRLGLKTTYYLKIQKPEDVEEDDNGSAEPAPALCSIDDPSCEACQ